MVVEVEEVSIRAITTFWLCWITGLFLGSGQRDEANVADAASPDAAAVVAMTSHAPLQPESG